MRKYKSTHTGILTSESLASHSRGKKVIALHYCYGTLKAPGKIQRESYSFYVPLWRDAIASILPTMVPSTLERSHAFGYMSILLSTPCSLRTCWTRTDSRV